MRTCKQLANNLQTTCKQPNLFAKVREMSPSTTCNGNFFDAGARQGTICLTRIWAMTHIARGVRYAVDGCMTCGNMKLLLNCMNEKRTIVNTNCFVTIADQVATCVCSVRQGLDIFFNTANCGDDQCWCSLSYIHTRTHARTHTHTYTHESRWLTNTIVVLQESW